MSGLAWPVKSWDEASSLDPVRAGEGALRHCCFLRGELLLGHMMTFSSGFRQYPGRVSEKKQYQGHERRRRKVEPILLTA
jgi:hypothetical protein